MAEIWQNFHFMRPYLLIMMLLIVPIYLIGKKRLDQNSSWSKVCDEHLFDFLKIKNNDISYRYLHHLMYLIILFISISIAGPSWEKQNTNSLSLDNPIMIVLNVSSDMERSDVSPSRLERAKFVIKDIMREIKGGQVGLIVYSREPFVILPLSDDPVLVENILPAINFSIMPENGDRLDRALDLAKKRMELSGYKCGNLVVITSDVGERFDVALQNAKELSEDKFRVNVINMGTDDNSKLKIIAENGGGLYLNYNQNIAELVKILNSSEKDNLQESENKQSLWLDSGYYFLFLPVFLILFLFRRGVFVGLLIFGICSNAYAGWFLNDNQEAKRYFDSGDYENAAQKFKHTQWRGSAEYKNGNYEAALREFEKLSGVDDLYNQGNALAKLGRISEAIKKYEDVLTINPQYEDAKLNLEYLKQQQKRQQQNQQEQQSQGEQQQNQQEQQSQGEQQQNQQEQQSQGEQQQNQQEQQSQGEQQQNQQEQQSQGEQQQNQQEQQSQGEQQQNQQEQQSQGEQRQNQQEQQSQGEQQQQQNTAENGDKMDTKNSKNYSMMQNRENQGEEEKIDAEIVAGGDEQNSQEREMVRAKMQKYREIPEDKGGLLRAFIRKEYEKNRYQD